MKTLLVRWILAATCAVALFQGIDATAQTVPVTSTNLSGSIAATNTFQTIQAKTNNRIGCMIQNTGSHTEYVFFGAATPTAATSIQLSPSQVVNCSAMAGSVVLGDAVSIAGTSGDTFYANFQ